jgi:hypothetical protein
MDPLRHARLIDITSGRTSGYACNPVYSILLDPTHRPLTAFPSDCNPAGKATVSAGHLEPGHAAAGTAADAGSTVASLPQFRKRR